VHGRPVDGRNFKWNISVNFGLTATRSFTWIRCRKCRPYPLPKTLGEIVAEEGKSYGGIYTSSLQRNTKGQVIVDDATGLPLVETDATKHYAGNYNPDWTGGVVNAFQYKSWTLSFQVDMRKGGVLVSGTQALLAANGSSQLTLPTGRRVLWCRIPSCRAAAPILNR